MFREQGAELNARDVVKVSLVHDQSQFTKKDMSFQPKMLHQIFQNETIYGYRRLSIEIYYLANSFHCYIDIKYEKYHEEGGDLDVADDVLQMLKPWFPEFTTSLDEFHALLTREQNSLMYGDVVNVLKHPNAYCRKSIFKVALCSLKEPGFEAFHIRYQSLIIMFIDAANFIDLSDERWMVYYLYEQVSCADGSVGNFPVGVCTVYKFFAFPDKIRARISQFLILPPYQRLGLGMNFLNSVYDSLKSMEMIHEIAVESPNKVFTHLRDTLDLHRLAIYPAFSINLLIQGFSKAMYDVAHGIFKLTARQARRVYEILRYYSILNNYGSFEDFKSDVINNRVRRIKRTYYREARKNNRTKLAFYKDLIKNPADHSDYLEQEFRSFIDEIQPTVKNLYETYCL